MARVRTTGSGVPDQFHFFELPVLSTGVEASFTDAVLPSSLATREDLIEFHIPASEYYTDPLGSILALERSD